MGALALCLPLGAGLSRLSEERNWFRSVDSDSIGSYLRSRINGYAVVTWIGFGVFLYVLWSASDGMAALDPRASYSIHSTLVGVALGGLAGLLLGCGLYGSVLNYQEIRGGDISIQDPGMSVQLVHEEEMT